MYHLEEGVKQAVESIDAELFKSDENHENKNRLYYKS